MAMLRIYVNELIMPSGYIKRATIVIAQDDVAIQILAGLPLVLKAKNKTSQSDSRMAAPGR
jgi:hypothetical protein